MQSSPQILHRRDGYPLACASSALLSYIRRISRGENIATIKPCRTVSGWEERSGRRRIFRHHLLETTRGARIPTAVQHDAPARALSGTAGSHIPLRFGLVFWVSGCAVSLQSTPSNRIMWATTLRSRG